MTLREIAAVYKQVFLNIEDRMDGQYPTAHAVTAIWDFGFELQLKQRRSKVCLSRWQSRGRGDSPIAFGYRSALGMDPRVFNRWGGNRVRNRQVAMFYRTTGSI